jgi:hypothetical protein
MVCHPFIGMIGLATPGRQTASGPDTSLRLQSHRIAGGTTEQAASAAHVDHHA